MDVHFVIVSPAAQQRSVAVRLPILVGRGDEAKFRIQQDSVSRRHCEFFINDDVVFVRDLGSTNGTLLDDEQIAASVATRVPPGTVVRVGGIAFRVDYESKAASLPAAAGGDDTVPMADNRTSPAPADETAPAEEQTACAGRVAAEATPPAEEQTACDGLPAADEPAPAGDQTAFAGLPAAEEPVAEGFDWLSGSEPPPPADDDKLDDFFKSLS